MADTVVPAGGEIVQKRCWPYDDTITSHLPVSKTVSLLEVLAGAVKGDGNPSGTGVLDMKTQ